MPARLESESKLQFYPTDVWETYRILGMLTNFDSHYRYNWQKEISPDSMESVIDSKTVEKIKKYCLDNRTNETDLFYEYLIKNNHFDDIKTRATGRIGGYSSESGQLVIADLFCGEGEWLSLFKTAFKLNNNIALVGNEIEKNRYKKAKNKLDYCYNKSFEELQFPKQSVSLMLYNPPYSGDGDERNSERYLQMIVDRQYLKTGHDYTSKSIIVMVLRVDDILRSMKMIVQNFNIIGHYKVRSEEYEKWKQVVIFATQKVKPLDITSRSDAITFDSEYKKWKTSIESNREFSYNDHDWKRHLTVPYFNIEEKLNNFVYTSNPQKYISNTSGIVWKIVKKQTQLKDNNVSKIIMPRYPKSSEIANIIASGYINTDIQGDVPHIATGGIKQVTKQSENKLEDGTIERVTIKQSLPYLNVLYTENGKVKIKELGEND